MLRLTPADYILSNQTSHKGVKLKKKNNKKNKSPIPVSLYITKTEPWHFTSLVPCAIASSEPMLSRATQGQNTASERMSFLVLSMQFL